MLFLRSWLEKYIDCKALSDEEIAQIITKGSSEVEEVRMLKDYFDAKVLVGRIENVKDHPNADKLRIFDVNLGTLGTRQIISSAPNVKEGLITAIAIEGARLPYFTVTKRQLKGEDSFGVCLGMSELALETEFSKGLFELEELLIRQLDAKYPNSKYTLDSLFGQPLTEALPNLFPEQTVFDIKILPNRITDIGHHIGMARELMVLCPDKIKPKQELLLLSNPQSVISELTSLLREKQKSQKNFTLEDKSSVSRLFMLFEGDLEGVYTLPHTYQMDMFLTQRNLTGTVADLSNYFLADFGQPTHFFDRSKVKSDSEYAWKITRTHQKASFQGLGNLKNAVLAEGIPVISTADDSQILAITGISGSEETKTDSQTTSLIIEIANFDPDIVAQSSFDLKYRSDASKIWSGGVNQLLVAYTALRLLKQNTISLTLCGLYDGKSGIVIDTIDQIQRVFEECYSSFPRIAIDWKALSESIDSRGDEYWTPLIKNKLELLGSLENNTFLPNVFFSNVQSEVDVLEDVVRLLDYDTLTKDVINTISPNKFDLTFESMYAIKSKVIQYGFQEVITRPFVSESDLRSSTFDTSIQLLNPYNSLLPYIRDSHIPSLLTVLGDNVVRGEKDSKVFEFGYVYSRDQDKILASRHLTLAGGGDVYTYTSLITTLIPKLIDSEYEYKEVQDSIGKGYDYYANNKKIGEIRVVCNAIKKKHSLPLSKKIYIAVLYSLDTTITSIYNSYIDETSYPVIRRTYSYRLSTSIHYKAIKECVKSLSLNNDTQILITPRERITLNNEYDSLSIDIEYRSYSKTLENSEIEIYEQELQSKLAQIGDISLR